jgi:hypothetical protein
MFKKLELMSRIIGNNNDGKKGGKRTVLESYSDNYASSAIFAGLAIGGIVATITTLYKWGNVRPGGGDRQGDRHNNNGGGRHDHHRDNRPGGNRRGGFTKFNNGVR